MENVNEEIIEVLPIETEEIQEIVEDDMVQDTFNTDGIDELLGEGVEIVNE